MKADTAISNVKCWELSALTRFRQYTYGRAVTVVTDHTPLESLNKRNINDCPARLQRMLLILQCYTYTIVYRPGSKTHYLTVCHDLFITVKESQRFLECIYRSIM